MRASQRIYGLECYGLNPAELRRLNGTPVRFSVQLTGRRLPGLLRLKPSERDARLRMTLGRQLRGLVERFPEAGLRPRDQQRASWTADGELPARRIPALATRPELQYVSIHAIKGRRKQRQPPSESWFCVWGLVAIQVEGRVRGMVDVEDRLVLVKARSSKHARQKLRGEWRDYGKPYMNPHGYLVRWHLVSVIGVYDTNLDSIDPDGTEVYSRLRTKRLTAEYRWSPKRLGV